MTKERAKVQQSVWTQGQGRQQKAGTPAAEGQGVFLWASESSPKQWMNSPLLQPGLTASHEKLRKLSTQEALKEEKDLLLQRKCSLGLGLHPGLSCAQALGSPQTGWGEH